MTLFLSVPAAVAVHGVCTAVRHLLWVSPAELVLCIYVRAANLKSILCCWILFARGHSKDVLLSWHPGHVMLMSSSLTVAVLKYTKGCWQSALMQQLYFLRSVSAWDLELQ